ncbi:MAG TPA: hypothetical protein VLL54_11250 [Pyrinomonadaceae bacterium]|nr:hypothetical protein [Pyrinomonadaceae bacterium]
MKKIIKALVSSAALMLVIVPAFVNTTEANAQAPAAAQGQCTDESKQAWYADFTKYRTTDSPKAYDAAMKYLNGCPAETGQIPDYLKKWTAAYEKEARKLKVAPLIYGEKKYPEGLALAKQILADEPENLRVIIDMGYGSYMAAVTLKSDAYNADANTYLRKAIQMIEAGKAPESWAPFKGKDDTLGYLYNSLGRFSLKGNPQESLKWLIKAAQSESDFKKDPWIYYFIGLSYETGPYVKLSADYKARFENQNETPESKLALANVQQVIDRMVDAYARAVALAGNDPKYATNKKDWMESLTTWYKYRHQGADTDLPKLLASVLTTPLPPEPTPLTELPASAPTTSGTPAPTGSSPTGTAMNTGTATQPAKTTTTVPAATTTTPKTTTPANTSANDPKPVKPKTRNNHRRH